MTLSQRINDYFNREAWQEARNILLRALKRTPDDHWLLSRLSTTYYEERDYAHALDIARRAAKLDSTCPLVLWDLAGALDAIGDKEQAIKIYERLLARGIERIANDECGEGEEWAKSFLADCKLRVALCYADEYFADVRTGAESIYKHEPLSLSLVCAKLVAGNLIPTVIGLLSAVPAGTAAKNITFTTTTLPIPASRDLTIQVQPATVQQTAAGQSHLEVAFQTGLMAR